MTTHKTTPAQRRAILGHVGDILASEGLAGLTVRKLAQHSGVAVGTVQYYFPTKTAMVKAAAEFVFTEMEQLLTSETTQNAESYQLLDRLTHALLPQNRNDRAAHIWLEVASLAALDASIAKQHSLLWRRVEDHLTELIAKVLKTSDTTVPRELATELLALLDGLTLTIITEPERMSATRARVVLDGWLSSRLQG